MLSMFVRFGSVGNNKKKEETKQNKIKNGRIVKKKEKEDGNN